MSNKAEALSHFLSPAPGQKTKTSPAALSDSIHNKYGAQSSGNELNYPTGGIARKSTYQKDLEELIAPKPDKGNAFNHEMVEATEGISRLSLD